MANTKHHQILIVGGGTAGVTVAASLRRRGPRSLDIAIVEPSDTHYYQPCFTLVGAGAYDMAKAQRPERSLIPAGRDVDPRAAKAFDPDKNSVALDTGDTLTYDYLVVCTGVKLDWDKIEGLSATLGKNGVCSNYSPQYAPYTWQCVQGLKSGSRAVFTQPPLPFKCPGAPQKIVYLTADRLRRAGVLQSCDLQYFVHAPVVFGVPFFARELMKVVARYGIKAHFQQNLVAVDGAAKTATFEAVGGDDKGKRTTVTFDMLHVSPPQSPHDAIAKSPLANAAGWVEVDQRLDAARPPPERLFFGRRVLGAQFQDRRGRAKAGADRRGQSFAHDRRHAGGGGLRRICLVPAHHGLWQGHHGRIHLWRQSHAVAASRSGEGALDLLVDQGHRIAVLLLALHAQGP